MFFKCFFGCCVNCFFFNSNSAGEHSWGGGGNFNWMRGLMAKDKIKANWSDVTLPYDTMDLESLDSSSWANCKWSKIFTTAAFPAASKVLRSGVLANLDKHHPLMEWYLQTAFVLFLLWVLLLVI